MRVNGNYRAFEPRGQTLDEGLAGLDTARDSHRAPYRLPASDPRQGLPSWHIQG